MELVLISSPSLNFNSKLPCTGEFMCFFPKFAGILMFGAIFTYILECLNLERDHFKVLKLRLEGIKNSLSQSSDV